MGTPPQQVVTSLPHNNVTLTNPFISSYKEAPVTKFGTKNNSLIEVQRTLLH